MVHETYAVRILRKQTSGYAREENMKLARVGPAGKEQPAIVGVDGTVRSLSGVVADISDDVLSPDGIESLRRLDVDSLPIIEQPFRYGPCVGSVSQFICVGLNYADHAEEAGMKLPEEPILFMKSPSAICGPNDDIIIPRNAEKVDWEVELGVVIGSHCSYVDERDAHEFIAGYCVVNDISERAFQLEGTGQWVKGKSADTFGPIGPWLVTADEVTDVQSLSIWLNVNEEEMQRSNTRQMVFGTASLISYISQYMTLKAGDIVSTGTPYGVGMGFEPKRYLQRGDRMTLGIDRLGSQTQKTVAWARK